MASIRGNRALIQAAQCAVRRAGCQAFLLTIYFGMASGTVAVPGEHSRGHDFTTASLVVESLADPRLYEALRFGNR